jgi:hypothetical protein
MTGEEQARIRERRKRGPLRLLVEGPDDMHAIIGLVSRHDVSWDSADLALPFVEDAGGVEKLLKGLPTAVSGPTTGSESSSTWTIPMAVIAGHRFGNGCA